MMQSDGGEEPVEQHPDLLETAHDFYDNACELSDCDSVESIEFTSSPKRPNNPPHQVDIDDLMSKKQSEYSPRLLLD